MKEHHHILELAAQNELPERIDSDSTFSVEIVRELVEAGYIKAINASSLSGVAFLNPKITLPGREYLAQLRGSLEGERVKNQKRTNLSAGLATAIPAGPGAWLEIRNEYGVSKSTFGKRISFVKNDFKRDVIFRDIEQAFLLARYGFYKPSVILAGGVIEELLRLYLEYKKVVPLSNNLDSYIKACETNRLLKDAIHRLADSVANFGILSIWKRKFRQGTASLKRQRKALCPPCSQ